MGPGQQPACTASSAHAPVRPRLVASECSQLCSCSHWTQDGGFPVLSLQSQQLAASWWLAASHFPAMGVEQGVKFPLLTELNNWADSQGNFPAVLTSSSHPEMTAVCSMCPHRGADVCGHTACPLPWLPPRPRTQLRTCCLAGHISGTVPFQDPLCLCSFHLLS